MSKTMADHARSYRQRRAEKMARMEAALREIVEICYDAYAVGIAHNALNPGKEMGK